MSIRTEIESQSAGATYFRVDLHIHSFGASHDVRDADQTPANIVAKAKQDEISVVAITDHNEISNVELAIKAAEQAGVVVIPGVELSTPQGHLLVYFRDYGRLAEFYGKLNIVDRGKPESRCQTGALDCLNLIDPQHGFAILAHVD
ncbi:MAG: PHP domain-containing protein, partial [Candidatus Zixiibacteriota bacterium]